MKSFALRHLPCFLLCATASFASTPPNPADYNVNLHVTSSRTVWRCTQRGATPQCASQLVLNATIDGANFELEGGIENHSGETRFESYDGFLAPGDYKAMPLSNKLKEPKVSHFVMKSYELLMPDGRLAKFQVTGQSE
jgi:hypothetical protein